MIPVRCPHSLSDKYLQRSEAIEPSVCKLIAVAPQATVATGVAATITLYALRRRTKYVCKDVLLFQLRHQPGAARNVVVKHDRGLARALSACNGDVQVGVRNFQRVSRASRTA